MQNKMKHYYLINGTVKASDSKMPDDENKIIRAFNIDIWKNRLKPCDIDESELEKIKNKVYTFDNCKADNQIDITDITDIIEEIGCECGCNESFIKFKQPTEKQVESDAVELFKVDGELKLIHRYGQPEYIRDARGVLVSFPKISKYEGQEERYLQEINESFSLANIIMNALRNI